MGTPNSTSRKSRKESEPNTQSEALGRLRDDLAACKPQLPYMSGFMPFAEYMLDTPTESGARRVDLGTGIFHPLPKGFSGNNRCFPLLVLSESHGGFGFPELMYKRGAIRRRELLLSQNGTLVLWVWSAQCRELNRELQEVGKRSMVWLLSPKMCRQLFRNPVTAQAARTALRALVERTITERRNRLVSMEALLGTLLAP